MTRLKSEWIEYMLDGMEEYNRNLIDKAGVDLEGLIREIYGFSQSSMNGLKKVKVGVVPITQGQGIIRSFSRSVTAIIKSMGFNAEAMMHTDVNGIYDAALLGCEILFFADDDRYLALNIANKRFADNNYATALGFIQVLRDMMKKRGKIIENERILQIGYGIVGKEAARIMAQQGISFDIYDKDESAFDDFILKPSIPSVGEIIHKNNIKDYRYILDFTNEGGWLKNEDLCENIIYASPGVPYSMDEEAASHFEKCSFHDNLEIGTAVMLGAVLEP